MAPVGATAPERLTVAILGAGPLGCALGVALAEFGVVVTLIDHAPAVVRSIAESGVHLIARDGARRIVRVPIVAQSSAIGPVDLVIVCVRYWQTEAAVRDALPIIGPTTTVLTLQAGWGDAEVIAALLRSARVAIGVVPTCIAGDAPGHACQFSHGTIFLGWDGEATGKEPLRALVSALSAAGWSATLVADIRSAAWRELASDACAAPLCALLGYAAPLLLEHAGTVDLMRALLREVATVAAVEGVDLVEDACWQSLEMQLVGADGNENARFLTVRRDLARLARSDVDRLNGAIVASGRKHGIPTPHNETILWLIRAQERRDDGIQ